MFSNVDWIYVLALIVVIYLVINILVYFLQDFLMFKPEKLAKDFQFYYENQEIEEYNIELGMVPSSTAYASRPKTLKGWFST